MIYLHRTLTHNQLRAAARTDAKTGLLNAATWQEEADREVSRATRTHAPLTVLIADQVTVPVVDLLEAVQVGDQDGQRGVGPGGPTDLSIGFLLPGRGVEQAGLGIGARGRA